MRGFRLFLGLGCTNTTTSPCSFSSFCTNIHPLAWALARQHFHSGDGLFLGGPEQAVLFFSSGLLSLSAFLGVTYTRPE